MLVSATQVDNKTQNGLFRGKAKPKSTLAKCCQAQLNSITNGQKQHALN